MNRLCQRVVALLTVVALLVATLPGDHACALAAEAQAAGDDPHACCKGADGALDPALVAAMVAETETDGDPTAAAPDATEAGDCGGSCCGTWLTGPAQSTPELAPALVWALLPAPVAHLPTPRLRTDRLHLHGARGPPPDPGRQRLHARHCVFLN